MNNQITKKVFVLIAVFCLNATLYAQIKPGVTLGVQFIGASPQGDFKEHYDVGGGGELFGGVGWGKTFIIATAGYSAFKAAGGSGSGTLTYVPLKIGLKQFLFRKLIFINGDIGIANVKNKVFNESRFNRGIGAGVRLFGLEASLYVDGWRHIDPASDGYQNSLFGKLGYSIAL